MEKRRGRPPLNRAAAIEPETVLVRVLWDNVGLGDGRLGLRNEECEVSPDVAEILLSIGAATRD